jgi:hypothetical protein
VAPQVLDVPMIEFVSRRHVIPRFAGRFVVGATFVSEWEDGNAVWRRLEEHTAGLIRTTLWLGTRTRLGQQRNLAERPETAELELNDGNASQVVTGIDRPLAVFIPNALDSDPTRGVSDYLGVVLGFLAINETCSGRTRRLPRMAATAAPSRRRSTRSRAASWWGGSTTWST